MSPSGFVSAISVPCAAVLLSLLWVIPNKEAADGGSVFAERSASSTRHFFSFRRDVVAVMFIVACGEETAAAAAMDWPRASVLTPPPPPHLHRLEFPEDCGLLVGTYRLEKER